MDPTGTYSATHKILHDHHNIFAKGSHDGQTLLGTYSAANELWAVGHNKNGLGQTSPLGGHVSAGNIVSHLEWDNLVSVLNNIKRHQTNVPYSISNGPNPIIAGSVITAITNLSSTLDTLDANRLLSYATGSPVTTTYYDETWTTTDLGTLHRTIVVDFQTYDKARYFFNAGGNLKFSFSNIISPTDPRETAFTTLLGTNLDTLTFYSAYCTFSGSGGQLDVNGTTIGYHDLTTSDQILFRIRYSTAPYDSSYVQISARSDAVNGGLNGDRGKTITFTITLSD
jgi:hypothetical protein